MSNDIHFRKMSKIQKNVLAKAADEDGVPMAYQRRLTVRTKSRNDDGDILFTATSPTRQHVLYNESESSPDHTQRDTNESDNNISSCSTLDIVNKIENMTLQSLETQVRELTERLQHNEMEKCEMQHQLQKANSDKEMCLRRMEVLGAAHECRITEMHCVIAELSKKLRAKQDNTILEEQEPEGSEISFQDVSIYNSELNLTNPDADAECQTDPLDVFDEDDYSELAKLGNPADIGSCKDYHDELKLHKSSFTKGQVEALQEEVLHLKSQIALLQSEMADSLRMDAPIKEKIPVSTTITDINLDNRNVEDNHADYHNSYSTNDGHDDDYDNSTDKVGEDIAVDAHEENLSAHADLCGERIILSKLEQSTAVIPKLAERVKLRHSKQGEERKDDCNYFHNEALHINSEEYKAQNPDIEVQSLKREIEKLKLNNTVLSLTLNESKEHCEHLYLLCGKYESNAIGLQLAVNCSDRAIEAYDVMLALLESNMALMLAEKTETAEENRKSVELVARHLLDRLETEKADVYENSLGPWQNNYSILDKRCSTPWTTEDDNRLRYHVSKLKSRRATVQTTIVHLESPFSQRFEQERLELESKQEMCQKQSIDFFKDGCAQNLEFAVLSQELLNLLDENISLKLKLDDCERERKYGIQRIGVLQEVLAQLQVQLTTVAAAGNIEKNNGDSTLFQKQPIANLNSRRASYAYLDAEAEATVLIEQQLIEALTRENELKTRIQTLIASVALSQKLSDDKHEELHSALGELKKTNQNLTLLVEQNKRKYHMKMRKLEQRIMDMSMEAGRQQTAITMQDHKESQQDNL